MRLDKIKLAGFKSFVDPTTVQFPSNLTGIVGPNGCGKSNVIDAVRWVMGEGSAKHLRGESMADVIFSGSASRKPVGQASIELLFDNSDGAVGDQYAQYSEISVKRQVGRDGTSAYYLNGTRCRRRDITDLFLGTGLGPRSYAIIEQGMISRFVEAKPEDLRVFLEEAAGISKYKERRRETENRIKHTRENLDRINDLRDELDRQLQHLQRQAKTAEKYKSLKEEERLLKAQLLCLQHQALDEQAAAERKAIGEKETEYEARVADLREIEAKLEALREQQVEASEAFNKVQAEYYRVSGEISRCEQAIQHGKDRQTQMSNDRDEIEQSLGDAQETLKADEDRVQSLQSTVREIEPAWNQAREAEHASAKLLTQAEETMQDWQLDWDEFNHTAAEPGRAMEVEQTRIAHLERHGEQLRERQQRFEEELNNLRPDDLQSEAAALSEELAAVDSEITQLSGQVQGTQTDINNQREANEQTRGALDDKRGQAQSLKGRQSSLEALQEAALGKTEGALGEWLRVRGLDGNKRLAEVIDVDEDWEHAVETVLGFYLESVSVDDLSMVAGGLEALEHGTLALIDKRTAENRMEMRDEVESLLSKVRSEWPLDGLLSGIYVAENLSQALAVRRELAAHESIITRDGAWIGANWLRVARDADEKAGVLHREHELKNLQTEIATLDETIAGLQNELEQGRTRRQELEGQRTQSQQELDGARKRRGEIQAALGAKQSNLEQVRKRQENVRHELAELDKQIGRGAEETEAANQRLRDAEHEAARLEEIRERLVERREELRARLDEAREQARADHDQAHQHALRMESLRTELNSTQEAMRRVQTHITRLEQQRDELSKALSEGEAPLRELEAQREILLGDRLRAENALNESRAKVQDIDQSLRELTEANHEADQNVQQVREQLEKLRMDFQGLKVRLQTVLEQIERTDFALDELRSGLEEQASIPEWEERMQKMEARIQRLGAINLAAIDEFKERSERKEYLDRQYDDLTEALTTLENAIHKIDRETRTRFKETFDKVNDGLKMFYPRLFGGGHAYLEMTSENILDTGIQILARPPGKRIGSIHLMSGGEKALTAVALVFAIFQLNPAPFCLLDEVDAPLDDANVGRFCELVKEMSDTVQFIFITHNKVTMELARQLTGVTMHEPGVSRLVAVDVDEAAAMAAG